MPFDYLFLFLLLGAWVGIFAGLFGIGGGGFMVPVLTLIFLKMHFPAEQLVHIALGTSMAAIVPTALASVRTHHAHGAVLWPVVVKMVPGILLGTFAGTFLASYLSATPLAIFFSCFMAVIALELLLDLKPKASRQLPNSALLCTSGGGIGAVSSLVAIGGGTLTVPFLTWCNVPLPVAIGTSAAVGLPIALSGAAGYFINGLHTEPLPPHTVGFIYWPAVLAITSASFFTAPVGAKLAHKLPVKLLKKLFSLLVVCLSVQMLVTVLKNS